MTSPVQIRNIDQMYWRKVLQQLGVIFLTAILSGCAATNDLLPDNFAVKKTSHHTYRHSASAADPDNVASEDYFQNQPNSQDNLWVAIKDDFQLNHYENSPQVQAQIAWFMHNQGYLNRTARRAAPFMYYIYQEIKARNLPSELVLLPIIESAYNPFVSSPAGAVGLWQIEPGTGRSFGLRQDFWYDGRRDISTSTKAALDYLSYLQNFFGGNWLLAIAAYDTGEGNVEAAMRRNARVGYSMDYFSLHLANETESYVPRLLALAVIISNPRKYPVDLPAISNAPYLGQVDIGPKINLENAARLAGISLAELKILNPGYKRSTPPNQPYKLLLPVDRISAFKRNALSDSSSTQSDDALWNRYKVQAGDTWANIAKRFNTSVDLIQSVNKLQDNQLQENTILLIPQTKSNSAAIATAITQEIPDNGTDNDEANNTTAEPTLSEAEPSEDNPTKKSEAHKKTIHKHVVPHKNTPHKKSEEITHKKSTHQTHQTTTKHTTNHHHPT